MAITIIGDSALMIWLTNSPRSMRLALLHEMFTVVHTASVSVSHLYSLNCARETMPLAGFFHSISTSDPRMDISMCHVE